MDLVTAAATDRPGCLRRLVLTSAEGHELGSFTASPAPAAVAPLDSPDGTGDVDMLGRNVVLVVRQSPEQR